MNIHDARDNAGSLRTLARVQAAIEARREYARKAVRFVFSDGQWSFVDADSNIPHGSDVHIIRVPVPAAVLARVVDGEVEGAA